MHADDLKASALPFLPGAMNASGKPRAILSPIS